MKKLLLLILVVLMPCICVASIILEEDFDSCTSGCETGTTAPNTDNQSSLSWTQNAPISQTAASVTHYTGEISSSGRGGSGKSLKVWRYGTQQLGSDSYSGTINIITATGGYTNFYLRYYVKIPINFDPVDLFYMKLFRLNGSASEFGNTNINWGGADPGTGTRGLASLQMMNWSDATWVELLTPEETTNDLWDGEWHCLQFQFNLSAHQMNFWLDGTLKKTINSNDFSGTWGGQDPSLQHLPMGNVSAATWGTTWSAMEMDDLVIATTKAETDPTETPVATGGGRLSGSLSGGGVMR